jgi:hypothetical protein
VSPSTAAPSSGPGPSPGPGVRGSSRRGAVGHLNVASGHGPWPEGEALLGQVRRGVAGAAWPAAWDGAAPHAAAGGGR